MFHCVDMRLLRLSPHFLCSDGNELDVFVFGVFPSQSVELVKL